jgi:diguanylate cyclase (GGDEF)-like protein
MRKQKIGILDRIGPSAGSRRNLRWQGLQLQAVAILLLVATSALVVVAPAVMSRTRYTALELLAIGLDCAYAIFLAGHSRQSQVSMERAYSGHLEELSQRLRTMAYQDALTGLYNHRYFHEQFAREIERSIRYAQPVAVLLMDMNNFKAVNDTFGHIIGDKFLSIVGQVIAKEIRGSDIGARYGGDEFVVILPNTTKEEALYTADKLAEAVAGASAMTQGNEDVRLGISIGFAVCPDDSRTSVELLRIADGRLYEVKERRGTGRQDERGIA